MGAAVLALVRHPKAALPERTTSAKLKYLSDAKTGASVRSLAGQLGVKAETLRGWLSGTRKPAASSVAKIDRVFATFWGINNANRFTRAAHTRKPLKIKGTPEGVIEVGGRPRSSILIERGRRDWVDILAATTPAEAWRAFYTGILVYSSLPPVDIEYLWFYKGQYTLTVQ